MKIEVRCPKSETAMNSNRSTMARLDVAEPHIKLIREEKFAYSS